MSFFSKKSGDLILILDVQSSIVRGTLVQKATDQVPLVLYTHNVPISFKADGTSDYLVKTAIQAIKDDVTDILKQQSGKISAVHYVLSSPWIVSQAKTLHLSFKEDTHITKAYVMGMIREERSKLSNKDDTARVVEEKVFDVRLNGYPVSSWESKFTRELQVSFVVSVAGGKMIDRLIEACENIVHRKGVQFHSSLFLQHIGVEKIVQSTSSYALIHVHGELTDVAVIENCSCVFFGSYPMGIQSVIRRIATQTGTDEQSADSLLSMSMKGHLDSAHAEKDLAVIDALDHEWIKQFQELVKTVNIPHNVIVSARYHEDFFMKSFATAYPRQSLEILAIESMTPYVAFDPRVEQLRLTGAYVIAIYSL